MGAPSADALFPDPAFRIWRKEFLDLGSPHILKSVAANRPVILSVSVITLRRRDSHHWRCRPAVTTAQATTSHILRASPLDTSVKCQSRPNAPQQKHRHLCAND